MSQTTIRPIYQFDRGLEEIYNRSDEEISLPQSVAFGPAQIAFSDQVDATLSPPDIEDFLRLSLMPNIDRALLAPHQFRDTLDQTAAVLRDQAPDPRAKEALGVIEADLALRELLSYYRNALIPG